MIEVREVKASGRELRPIQKGWGSIHWLMCLPPLIPFAGLWALSLLATDLVPWQITIGILVATISLWILAQNLIAFAMRRAGGKAPTAAKPNDWVLDRDGFRCAMPVAESRFKWEAVKDVAEERDRFIFLLTFQANPVLPKRCLTEEQIDQLRVLIAEARASGRMGRGVD